MSRYIKDIDDSEFVEIVKELEAKDHFFSKVAYNFEITGIQCLLTGHAEVRRIQGVDYFWGVIIEDNYQADHVMNIVCRHHASLFYEFLSNPFLEKFNSLKHYRLRGLIEIEKEEIKGKIEQGSDFFKLGYRSEKRADDKIHFNGTEPTNETCWEVSIGAAYYRFELLLNGSLRLLDEHDRQKSNESKADVENAEEIDEPAFNLDTQYETVLYFKYSGLQADIYKRVRTVDNTAKVIAQLSGGSANSIRQLLMKIAQGYTSKTKDENVFKKQYVENTINALRDSGFDTTELSKVFEQILKDERL